MDVSEAWKYERDWKTLRRKPLGEILQMKFVGSEYWKDLVEMELKRRTFVRDVLIDRILSASAIVISITALVLTCSGLSPTAQAVSPPPDGEYGGANTAEGNQALFSLTTGSNNTALGSAALFSVTAGVQNTATGAQALTNNIADRNTADGFQALVKNNDANASDNTATGWRALFQNTTGDFNTANGSQALYKNTTGRDNTAVGFGTLPNNTTGAVNTAVGEGALRRNTIGRDNTAVGSVALEANTTGSDNIALGFEAGVNLTTGDNNIDIGSVGVPGEANTIRIGTVGMDTIGAQTATFIAGIRDTTTANMDAIAVVIDSAGQLGTMSSSRRFKNEIKPMDKTSEAILALKPVTFHYKSDTRGTPQFGLIAEEVARVNPDLVVRDKNGDIYTVRYDAVNAMLLNEFLKEHRKVQELEANAVRQQKEIETLTAGLQKVSAQLGASRPAPQVADNN